MVDRYIDRWIEWKSKKTASLDGNIATCNRNHRFRNWDRNLEYYSWKCKCRISEVKHFAHQNQHCYYKC